MYLSYEQYLFMGGSEDNEAAFDTAERKAEYLINSQAFGQTGERIKKLGTVPDAVVECTYFLVEHLLKNAFDGSNVQSESQSQSGVSESITYLSLTKEQSDAQINEIIYNCFFGGGMCDLLYGGADI